MNMRAAVFESSGQNLSIREVPVPTPGPGQLLLKVHRCGVCGSDLHMTEADSAVRLRAGTIIGHEFAGEVVDVGVDVRDRWQSGQRVTAMPYIGCGSCADCANGMPVRCARVRSLATGGGGGFAEYVLVGSRETFELPQAVGWEHGAFVEPLAVGVHAVIASQLHLGARVLVIGAGPVGLAVAACARVAGAETVCVTARSDGRRELAKQMGATDFLIVDETLAERFRKSAGGSPDIIFECAGVPGMFDLCARLASVGTRVIMVGACMHVEATRPIVATAKELLLQFVVAYSRRDFATALRLIADGRVDPLPMHTATVGLDAFPETFESLRSARAQCKVLLDPSLG